MITANIVADSINTRSERITTFRLTYPRFIHNELMTHRAFSRNAASSRAIPFRRMVEMVETEPAMPVVWASAQKGMQGGEELDEEKRLLAQSVWLLAMKGAIAQATNLDSIGVHKSISNRLLEPFAHMTTIVTATEWYNFYGLRAHPEAQPEFQHLAFRMLDAYLESSPVRIENGDWHLPLIGPSDYALDVPTSFLIKMCVARCARVSYINFKDSLYQADIALHDRLAASGHWSPFEHAATPHPYSETGSNFRGWFPYRKQFGKENIRPFNLRELAEKAPWRKIQF